MDPELAHTETMRLLALISYIPPLTRLLHGIFGSGIGTAGKSALTPFYHPRLPRPWPGRFGLPAGLDKLGEAIPALAALGFAFVEVGTTTLRPQPGNEKPRLWRILPQEALRNRMGFNNEGAAAMAENLRKLRSTAAGRRIIVGANIGKNKTTPAADAPTEYQQTARMLAPWADYLVINVSSPNTPGLRDLQNVESLEPIAVAVRAGMDECARMLATDTRIPLLIKIAPDLNDADMLAVADMVNRLDIDGVVATNTTINHDYGDGGLSGPPLRERALQAVEILRGKLDPDRLIIGCGGISDAEDAADMLNAGADLVAGYTGFIYNGPSWPGAINRAIG